MAKNVQCQSNKENVVNPGIHNLFNNSIWSQRFDFWIILI